MAKGDGNNDLELNIGIALNTLNRQLRRAEADMTKTARKHEIAFQKANKKIAKQFEAMKDKANKSMSGIGLPGGRAVAMATTALTSALGARELVRMTDLWTDLNSRARLAAGGIEQGNAVMERLGNVARRTYSALDTTVESYLANNTTLRDLGYTTNQTLDYTEALNNALVISGAKGDRAKAVQSALAKAMANGKLQGDNLNTVIESGGRVAEALAESLGTTVSGLRALGTQGKITSRDIYGITTQAERLREEAGAMPGTISDGFQLINNALLQYVGNADQAHGVSGQIAAGLELIADNFDTVADEGLKVAAIIAGVLVGRSMVGMIRTAALGVTGLNQLTRALVGVRSASGAMAAFGGLGAAAGPAGMLVGGALVAGLVAYNSASQLAEQRTERVTAELEKLGLITPRVSEAVGDITQSLDNLTDVGRIEKIRDLAGELDRLRGGGVGGRQWFFGPDADSFAGIRNAANQAQGYMGRANDFLPSDMQALRQMEELASLLNDANIEADEALRKFAEIERQELSTPARALRDQLHSTMGVAGALETRLLSLGSSSEMDGLIAQIGSLRNGVQEFAEYHGIDQNIVDEMANIIDAFISAETKADDANTALEKIAAENAVVGPYVASLAPLFTALQNIRDMATNAGAALATLSERQMDGYRQYQGSRADGLATEQAQADYIAEQRRINALTQQQLDLENEIASVRKKSQTDGVNLTEGQVRDLAAANIAAKEGRKDAAKTERGSGGKGKFDRDKDRYGNEVIAVREAIAAYEAEAQALNNAAVSLSGYADIATYAQKRMELLVAAKKQGLEITPKLGAEIDQLAQDYVTAANGADLARDRHERFEEALTDFRSEGESIFVGLVTGADSFSSAIGRVASKLAEMSASRAFEMLLDGNGGRGKNGGMLGGIFGSIASWFGGARAKGGPVRAGTPYLVNEDTANSEIFVPSRSGAILNVAQAQEAISGRMASARSMRVQPASAPQIVYVPQPYLTGVTVSDDGKLMAQMHQVAGGHAAGSVAALNRQLPTRQRQIAGNPWKK